MAQSSEPILIPKLRIYFADFPYLRYSIGQRLFTLETCCGYGYDFARNLHTSPPDFQGPTQALRMAQDLCHFWWSLTLSPGKPIPGFTLCVENHLIRKDNSLRNLRQRLWIHLCYHTSYARTREGTNIALSVAKCGIINPLPFRTEGDIVQALSHFRTELTYSLGSTDPCSTAVHMETFSTSAFKVLI